MFLLDTHAAIWFATEDTTLGRRSRALISRALADTRLAICSISFWKIAMLVSKKRIEASVPPLELRALLLDTGIVELPLTGDIAMQSAALELLQGRLSEAVMERICRPASGLFPSQGEIEFRCSCPDWADMCKHVTAVFYGIGARLDKQPELLFTLRCVDAKDLVARAGTLTITGRKPASARTLADSKLADVFGIDITDIATPGAKRAAKPVARLNPRLKVPAAEKKPAAPAKKKARSRNTPSGSTGRGTSIRARKGAGK